MPLIRLDTRAPTRSQTKSDLHLLVLVQYHFSSGSMNYGQLASQVLLQSWGSRKSDVIVAIREREGNNTMLRLLAWERVGEDA